MSTTVWWAGGLSMDTASRCSTIDAALGSVSTPNCPIPCHPELAKDPRAKHSATELPLRRDMPCRAAPDALSPRCARGFAIGDCAAIERSGPFLRSG